MLKAAGSYSALRINLRFPQGVKLHWGILGMYATQPEENGIIFFLLLCFWSFLLSIFKDFYVKPGGITLHFCGVDAAR